MTMMKDERIGPLFTDLYELTMAAAYFNKDIVSEATFSLFTREYENRNYFTAAGLEFALKELEGLYFSDGDIAFLREKGLFDEAFLSFLGDFRFSGDDYALPEGTLFFADEPVLEVTAPIIEAQIIETFLINTIGFSSLIATKAARCVYAADGRPLIDFALRRTHGQDAGMKVARSTYIAGFTATSNVLAGKIYNIPLSGTMAHSYVTAFDSEKEAFAAYIEMFPENAVFLIDTYDTLEGAKNAVDVALQMKARGNSLVGVRLDSGDMISLSHKVRRILDAAGLVDVKIFASSGFDEYKITDILAGGAEIDAFGVGTKAGVSADAPYMDMVYKLVRFDKRDIRKFSPGKMTLAGEKQVFRIRDENDMLKEDIIGLRDEKIPGAVPLLVPVIKKGKAIHPPPSLDTIRACFLNDFDGLSKPFKTIREKVIYPVKLSRKLRDLQHNTTFR